ncbi:MAG: DUF1015 domain-containing protein [Lachnospiraceae bacterium]|nr:DUF1015 domain-containing protein [Lachnospiraceae bacterium]
MAQVTPFRAYRPTKELAAAIAALPYDVVNREEATAIVKKNPDSFLAIDRAETQFPAEVDTYAEEVYAKARTLLDEKIENGSFVQDETPCYYLYEQTWQGRTQTGIVACASIDDYLNGVVKKHENTVEAKEQDRIRHVDTCDAQTGPIFLAYRHNDAIAAVAQKTKEKEPVYEFSSTGGVENELNLVHNRIWVIADTEDVAAVREAFAGIDAIYIADGHHRCASAVKVGLRRREAAGNYTGEEEWNRFLCVLFPEDELKILDYNRVVKDLNGLTRETLLIKLKEKFQVKPYKQEQAKPTAKGEIGMFLGDSWYMLQVPNNLKSGDPVDGLDVSLLQREVLTPLFGIEDPRTDHRIEFVGGIRGLSELEKRVAETGGVAFSMYPTAIGELFAVADAGRLMPPKSTWFEPKLLSGLFIHKLS